MLQRLALALFVVTTLLVAGWISDATAVTPIEVDCLLNASGTTAAGQTFSGEAASQPGFVDADWFHDDEAAGFHLQSFDRAIDVTCLQNDSVQASIDGWAVVNGELGYLYSVTVRDQAANDIIFEAPGGDATTTFSSPTTVVIPAELAVTSGTAGRGLAFISFDDMKCFYRPNSAGTAYSFSWCEDRSLRPGDTLVVTSVRLFVAGSDRDTIVVSANLGGGGGSSGPVDQYTINVWYCGDDFLNLAACLESAVLAYSGAWNVAEGAIVVTVLP